MLFEGTLFFKVIFGLLFLSAILAALPYSFWMMFITNERDEDKK